MLNDEQCSADYYQSDFCVGKEYIQLRDEFLKSVLKDPCALVRTPGFRDASFEKASYVIMDNFAGENGPEAFEELLRIAALCAKGAPISELAPRALLFFQSQANKYGWFHSGCEDD